MKRLRLPDLIRKALPPRLFDTLVENSLYGVAITGVNSVVGFVFWVLTARLYSAHAVGLATALIAAMTLVSLLSNLGGGAGLVQRLPTRRSAREWSVTVNASLLLCAVLGLVASALTVLVLPLVSNGLSVVQTSPAYALTLTVGIVMCTLSMNMDFLFVAERKVKYGFVRNAAFSLVKVPAVVIPVLLWSPTPLALFAAWVVSLVLALMIAIQIARRRLAHRWSNALAGVGKEIKAIAGSLVGHHLINLGGTLPMYVLPLIVTARLGVVQNAWAYIGWMVGGFALVASPTVSASLFAEGSHDPAAFARQARRSFRIIAVLYTPLIVAVLLFGHSVLRVFGAQYAKHSYGLVVILALSAIPDAITNIYVVRLRVGRRLATAGFLNVGMGLLAVVLAWFLVRPLGVAGIAWSWLIAQTAGSVYVIARARAERASGRGQEVESAAAPACTDAESGPFKSR